MNTSRLSELRAARESYCDPACDEDTETPTEEGDRAAWARDYPKDAAELIRLEIETATEEAEAGDAPATAPRMVKIDAETLGALIEGADCAADEAIRNAEDHESEDAAKDEREKAAAWDAAVTSGRAILAAGFEPIEPDPDCEDKHATVAAAVEAAINAGARVIQAAFGQKHGDLAGHYFADASMCADHLRAVFADYFDTEQRNLPERAEWSGSQHPCAPDTFWLDDKTGERVNAETGERAPDFTPTANERTTEKMPAHLAREGYRLEFGADERGMPDVPSAELRGRYWWTLCRNWAECSTSAGDWATPAEAIADAATDCAAELARGADAFTG